MHFIPGQAELARRAAGGDGAAFVRVYDRHAAEVLELALAATGSEAAAAEATQSAFLMLLRRPPALAAPDADVVERLLGLVLHACGAEDWPADRRPVVRPRRVRTSGGRLRHVTVMTAGARFDQDWSVHLGPAPLRAVAGGADRG